MHNIKPYLPDGITEEQFVEIVNRVSRTSAIKFLFGFHDVSDHQQHAFTIAIKILSEGKFKPRGEKSMEVQLTNFLRVWIHNRLSNFRRDSSCRYPNKGGANQVKYNIMHALPINSFGLTNSEIFARENTTLDKLSLEDIIQRIKHNLNKSNRRLYDKYIDGQELTPQEQEKLFKAIRKILPGDPEEYI